MPADASAAPISAPHCCCRTNSIEASRIATELDRLNRERQTLEQTMLVQAEAEALAALGLEEKGAVVVTAAEGWHPGVVGLIAARLKERFGRPAFAIAIEPGGVGTGSGRSIAGVDLGKAVRQAVADGLAGQRRRARDGGGRHGRERRARAVSRISRTDVERRMSRSRGARIRLLIDGAVTAAGANTDLIATVARAGPYGAGNPEPVFAIPGHILAFADEVGTGHIRARLKAPDGAMLNAIAFRAMDKPLGQALLQNRGQAIHVAGTLSVDRWQGAERVQLRLIDAAPVPR